MTIEEIDKLSGPAFYTELNRLLEQGGTVRAEGGVVTLFTTATQHVTAPNMDVCIKRALVQEKLRSELRLTAIPSMAERNKWLDDYKVPNYLR